MTGDKLQYTPLAEIPSFLTELRDVFDSGKTRPVQFRLNQLRNLYFAIEDNLDAFADALYLDFHKSKFETKMMEGYVTRAELIHVMENLAQWLKPASPYAVPLVHATSNVKVERIPLGVVAIIAPFNYPLLLTLSPLLGSIASGNCTILKLSELTPNFSALLSKVLTSALDPDIFRVVNGAIDETSVLLQQKFDLIFFTGSTKVGKIVAESAAKNLTPVVLELGGKSPAIVTKSHGNLKTIARRLLWGKLANAGQTCVAVDYVLCDSSVQLELCRCMKELLEQEFYKDGLDDFTQLVNPGAFKNLEKILESTRGDIIVGGLSKANPNRNFIPPTIITNVGLDDSSMQQELFGPILPIVPYDDLETTLRQVQAKPQCKDPLALYIFSNDDKTIELIKTQIRSGALSVNDDLIHVGIFTAPFGGVGSSGHGSYHGRQSLDTFSHKRTTMRQPFWIEMVLNSRYPPYTDFKNRLLRLTIDKKPYFRRDGDVPVNKTFQSLLQLFSVIAITGSVILISLWIHRGL